MTVGWMIFFLMIRRPPRSTLFPTRRSSDLTLAEQGVALESNSWQGLLAPGATPDALVQRSEEHTSELQSQSNLVCRLLLEKKKKHPIARIVLRYKRVRDTSPPLP